MFFYIVINIVKIITFTIQPFGQAIYQNKSINKAVHFAPLLVYENF